MSKFDHGNNEDFNFYSETLKLANIHLIETDKKRNQLIAFYAVVVGVFLGSFDKLGFLKDIITLMIAFLGLFSIVILTNYRKWHLLYVNVSMVISYLWINKLTFEDQNLYEAWEKHSFKIKFGGFWLNPFKSTEAAIFNLFLTLSFLPWYLIIVSFPYKPFVIIQTHVASFTLYLILYLISLNCFSYYSLSKLRKSNHFEVWLLNIKEKNTNNKILIP